MAFQYFFKLDGTRFCNFINQKTHCVTINVVLRLMGYLFIKVCEKNLCFYQAILNY